MARERLATPSPEERGFDLPEKRRRGRRRKDDSGEKAPEPGDALAEVLGQSTDGTAQLAERTPPQDLDAEQATLGAMLMERQAIERARMTVQPADFYAGQHRLLCRVIYALADRGEPVDLVTLGAELQASDDIDNVGGTAYLVALQEAAPTAAAVAHYARIVREHSIRRIQATAAQSLRLSLYEGVDEELHRAAMLGALELSVSRELAVVPMDELIAEAATVEWLVEPLVPLRGVTVLYADGGTGKSHLALSLCYAVANGHRRWLDRFPLRGAAAAIYVDGEAGPASMRERLVGFDLGAGWKAPEPEAADWEGNEHSGSLTERPLGLVFPNEPSCPVFFNLGPGAAGMLEPMIREWRAKVVVLDSLLALAPPRLDINSAQDAAAVINRLRRLAARTGCAIILILHERKWQPGMPGQTGTQLGSTAWVDRPDSALRMLALPDSTRLVVHRKYRLAVAPEPTFRVTLSANERGQGTIMLYDGVWREEAGAGIERAMEVMLEALGAGSLPRADLLALAQEGAAVRARQANEALSRLRQEGKVERRQVGHQAWYLLRREA